MPQCTFANECVWNPLEVHLKEKKDLSLNICHGRHNHRKTLHGTSKSQCFSMTWGLEMIFVIPSFRNIYKKMKICFLSHSNVTYKVNDWSSFWRFFEKCHGRHGVFWSENKSISELGAHWLVGLPGHT